jgi:hypothetical protein
MNVTLELGMLKPVKAVVRGRRRETWDVLASETEGAAPKIIEIYRPLSKLNSKTDSSMYLQ